VSWKSNLSPPLTRLSDDNSLIIMMLSETSPSSLTASQQTLAAQGDAESINAGHRGLSVALSGALFCWRRRVNRYLAAGRSITTAGEYWPERCRQTSLSALSRQAGLASSMLANALTRRWPKGERLIAEALGVAPEKIRPSRYC
jgi:Ner family transcriptional regulator